MSRPKGSLNKSTDEIERLQNKINTLEKSTNTYQEVVSAFTDGFVLELTSNVKNISLDTLSTWFNNPDANMSNISNLLSYYFICDGDIFQLFDLIFSLPKLDYKIKAYEKTGSYDADMILIKKTLEKTVKHKALTRDLLSQLAHDGTVIGTWLGNAKKPYFYAFDNLEYVYPYGRFQGDMIGVIDLKWIETMNTEEERLSVFNNLKPLVTQKKYDKWKNEPDYIKKKETQYITLPVDKTLVARTHTLNRNQRLGVPFGTQVLFDIQHKNKMKELERSVADKIIRAIAVLKFKGKDDNDIKVQEKLKAQVFAKVKKALTLNNSDKSGLTVLGLPDFSTLEYPEFKNGDKILSPEKYESTNLDIANGTGISRGLTTGEGGNFASNKLNLDLIYQKISVLLEEIEDIYNKLIVIILGEEKGSNYTFEYDKETPVEKSARISTLMTLQAQGYSTTHVLNELGINAEEYFAQSVYEIDELKLREKVIPPMSTYTMTGKDDDGIGNKPTIDSPVEDNTVASKGTGGNKNPKAKVKA